MTDTTTIGSTASTATSGSVRSASVGPTLSPREEPLEVRIAGAAIAVVMRTPGVGRDRVADPHHLGLRELALTLHDVGLAVAVEIRDRHAQRARRAGEASVRAEQERAALCEVVDEKPIVLVAERADEKVRIAVGIEVEDADHVVVGGRSAQLGTPQLGSSRRSTARACSTTDATHLLACGRPGTSSRRELHRTVRYITH